MYYCETCGNELKDRMIEAVFGKDIDAYCSGKLDSSGIHHYCPDISVIGSPCYRTAFVMRKETTLQKTVDVPDSK